MANVSNFTGDNNRGIQIGQHEGPIHIHQEGGKHLGTFSDEARRQILQWLSTVQYLRFHKSTLGAALLGIGEWLFYKREFLDWHLGIGPPTLWLHGIRT
jgi:hypothetical protein